MCTLTWWQGRNGYEVFFNRDERLTRPVALPPTVEEWDGVRFVCPLDVPSGGTWLLANERGLTLAILNYYEREEPEPPAGRFHSRGLLVRSLAACPDLETAAEHLRRIDPAHWNAFSLIGFDQGPAPERQGFRVWRWLQDGETLQGPEPAPDMPVCSSSFHPERVVAARKRLFNDLRETGDPESPDWLESYHHADGGGSPTAETVLMRRPDARTWSFSRVRVTPGRVRFEYEAFEPAAARMVCDLERR